MNTQSAETVLVCKVCQRCLNPTGEWIYVQDFGEFLYMLKYFLVEHTVCPECLAKQEKEMVFDPVL